MKKRQIIGFLIILSSITIGFSVAQASAKKSEQNHGLHFDVEDIQKTQTYDYAMSGDLKLHLTLSKELFDKPTGIFIDGLEISRNFKHQANGDVSYVSDFNLKPGHHTLSIGSKVIDISARYVFDTKEHYHDIKSMWNSRSEKFATLTKNGILLKNTDRDFGSFAFKRFYCDNLTATFEFMPIDFKPGVVVYFGDNIYFIVNRNNILTMKKNENRTAKNNDIRLNKTSIPRIRNNEMQILRIERKADTYNVVLNGQTITTLQDSKELKNQRFKNIGISIPKNEAVILIKKIVIE